MMKKQESTPEEKAVNKEIAAVIHYYHLKRWNRKPDVSEYKSGHNILKPLMMPDDYYTTYNFNEIRSVIDYLIEEKVNITSLSILQWPGLIATVVRGNEREISILIRQIKNNQIRNGEYVEDEKIPKGW